MPISGAVEHFQTGALNKAPEGPGVFQCLSSGSTIFIGWAGPEGIRKKLLEHYSGKHGTCTKIATDFTCEEHEDPEARCAELLLEYKAKHSVYPRCNR